MTMQLSENAQAVYEAYQAFKANDKRPEPSAIYADAGLTYDEGRRALHELEAAQLLRVEGDLG